MTGQMTLDPMVNKSHEFQTGVLAAISNYRGGGDLYQLVVASKLLQKHGRRRFATALAQHGLKHTEQPCHPAVLQLCRLLLENGNFSIAKRRLLELTKTDAAFDAHEVIVELLSSQGRLSRALHMLKCAISRFPQDYRYYLALARLLQRSGRLIEAIEAYLRCVALPECPIEAMRSAAILARAMNKHKVAYDIVCKMSQLHPTEAEFHALRGVLLWELDRYDASRDALKQAWSLDSRNLIHYLNASIPSWRISPHGSSHHKTAQKVKTVIAELQQSLEEGDPWEAKGCEPLLPLVYWCAYSPLNMQSILRPLYDLLHTAFEPLRFRLRAAQKLASKPFLNSSTFPPNNRRIRLGVLSANFNQHSNLLAYSGLLHYLDRTRFELVVIHSNAKVIDQAHLELNNKADEVVYLHADIDTTYSLLISLALDILFFTDRGFNPYDFVLPDLRTCAIQVTGWGVPHTSGLCSIDYYLSSSWLEGPENQSEYTEKLVLLDGLPGCLMSKDLHFRVLNRSYFMLPEDRVILGCLQNLWKIHPDFDLVLERIAHRLPDVLFVFVDSGCETANQRFQERLARRAPRASKQTLFLARCDYSDFLSLCDCLDIQLDTPYYGAGVTGYLSMYVGTPFVTLAGARLRDQTVTAIYNYLDIDDAPVADSISDYVEQVVNLASDPGRRLSIKKATVAASHRLYDNHEYVRSFERFCVSALKRQDPAACFA